MTETQIKNHEMDQSTCFDLEKNQDNDQVTSGAVRGRDGLRSKIKQESSTLKPLRKKRRQLTGW
jgi:hypothetical protein